MYWTLYCCNTTFEHGERNIHMSAVSMMHELYEHVRYSLQLSFS